MTYITLIAVIGILLLQWVGAFPQASVGGPLSIVLACFAAALAVAIHEAWTRKRGVLGWIVNILVAPVGAFLAARLGAIVMDLTVPFEGSIAATAGPVMYAVLAGLMLLTLLGAWGALWLVNRLR
jgi:hypothetical protein